MLFGWGCIAWLGRQGRGGGALWAIHWGDSVWLGAEGLVVLCLEYSV